MAQMDLNERIHAAITAQVNGDPVAITEVMKDLPQAELAAFAGGLLAYCGNMIVLHAHAMDCTPSEAWEVICRIERKMFDGPAN
jgi:hypothetical protein